jgi:hypothetical protein
MEAKSQSTFFFQILDRLLSAPVNLFFDVTPIGRILSYFSDDIKEINSQFFTDI